YRRHDGPAQLGQRAEQAAGNRREIEVAGLQPTAAAIVRPATARRAIAARTTVLIRPELALAVKRVYTHFFAPGESVRRRRMPVPYGSSQVGQNLSHTGSSAKSKTTKIRNVIGISFQPLNPSNHAATTAKNVSITPSITLWECAGCNSNPHCLQR